MNVSYRVLLYNWICHSQALNLHVLIGRNNATASLYPEQLLTSHLLEEAQGRGLEFKRFQGGQTAPDVSSPVTAQPLLCHFSLPGVTGTHLLSPSITFLGFALVCFILLPLR